MNSKFKTTPAIQSDFHCVRGEFAARNLNNIKATVTDYPWAMGVVDAMADNPDATAWLVLADRLAEEGNPAEHIIRAVFEDNYKVPTGFTGGAGRHGHYWENGSNYSEGLGVDYKQDGYEGPGLYHTYWSNGNFTRKVTVEEARTMLTKLTGPRCSKWREITVEGKLPPTSRILPIGTKVTVQKVGEEKARQHTTTTIVAIPDKFNNTYTVWGGIETACVEFEHMGYNVTACLRDIQSLI